MEDLLAFMVKLLVNNPEKVKVIVDNSASDGTFFYRIYVDESDKGRVIGKNGRIAKSLRSVLHAAALKKNMKVYLEIG